MYLFFAFVSNSKLETSVLGVHTHKFILLLCDMVVSKDLMNLETKPWSILGYKPLTLLHSPVYIQESPG